MGGGDANADADTGDENWRGTYQGLYDGALSETYSARARYLRVGGDDAEGLTEFCARPASLEHLSGSVGMDVEEAAGHVGLLTESLAYFAYWASCMEADRNRYIRHLVVALAVPVERVAALAGVSAGLSWGRGVTRVTVLDVQNHGCAGREHGFRTHRRGGWSLHLPLLCALAVTPSPICPLHAGAMTAEGGGLLLLTEAACRAALLQHDLDFRDEKQVVPAPRGTGVSTPSAIICETRWAVTPPASRRLPSRRRESG